MWNVFPFQVARCLALMWPENGPMRIFWLIATDPKAGNLDRFLSGRTKCVPVRGLRAIFSRAHTHTHTLEKFADWRQKHGRDECKRTGNSILFSLVWKQKGRRVVVVHYARKNDAGVNGTNRRLRIVLVWEILFVLLFLLCESSCANGSFSSRF